MYLSKVRIKNFRGFKDLVEIEFAPNLTIFTGKNASGKTTILQAVQYALISLGIQNKSLEEKRKIIRQVLSLTENEAVNYKTDLYQRGKAEIELVFREKDNFFSLKVRASDDEGFDVKVIHCDEQLKKFLKYPVSVNFTDFIKLLISKESGINFPDEKSLQVLDEIFGLVPLIKERDSLKNRLDLLSKQLSLLQEKFITRENKIFEDISNLICKYKEVQEENKIQKIIQHLKKILGELKQEKLSFSFSINKIESIINNKENLNIEYIFDKWFNEINEKLHFLNEGNLKENILKELEVISSKIHEAEKEISNLEYLLIDELRKINQDLEILNNFNLLLGTIEDLNRYTKEFKNLCNAIKDFEFLVKERSLLENSIKDIDKKFSDLKEKISYIDNKIQVLTQIKKFIETYGEKKFVISYFDIGLEDLNREEKHLQELKKRYLDEISSIDENKRKLLDEIQIIDEKIHNYQSLEKTIKNIKQRLYTLIEELKQKLNPSAGKFYLVNSLLTSLKKELNNSENLLEIKESIINKLQEKVEQLKELKKEIENTFSYDYFKGDYVLKYGKLQSTIEYLEELDPDKALDLKNLLNELEIIKHHLKNLREKKSNLERIRDESKQARANLKKKLEDLKSVLVKIKIYIELNKRYAILFEQTLPVFEKKSNKWKEKIFTNIEKERINLSEKLKELRNKIKKTRNKNLENLNRVLNKYFLQAYNALNVGGLRIQVNEISTDKWFYSFEVLNKQGLTLQGLNQSVKDIANIVLLLSLMETFPEMSQYFILSIIDEALERTDEENTKVFLNKIIPMLSSKVQTLIAILDKNYQYINKNNFRNLHVIIYKMQGIENGLPKYEKEVIL